MATRRRPPAEPPRAAPPVDDLLEIVAMKRTDVEAVMEIERHAFVSPWSRDVFLDELQRENAWVDLLRERASGRVLAFVNFWLVADEVHVLNVATHFDERRKGHAARLLDHVVEFAREHRVRYVTLEVRRSNQPAIRLYRRFGFRPVGIRPNYYPDEREDAIVMLLELGR